MRDDLFVWKKFAKIGLVGLIPLIFIFVFFKASPGNPIFYDIFNLTHSIKSNISSNNILLSKPLGLYVGFAILFSVYFVLKYGNLVKLKQGVITPAFIIMKFVPFSLIAFIYIYFMVFYDLDVTEGNRLLRFVSSSDFLLLSYYLVSFIGVYCFSMLFLLLLIKSFSVVKNN
ncbi:colicin immunity protein Cui [Serratia sp. C2(1)]|uniref:colicin immunity protein Cui n=1 Tax=Serratia sp. C2(1) TaxID=3117679 RepID=UPI002ED081A4|nr:colicin immunity protein Cui [Serratia sp. C2(1)]